MELPSSYTYTMEAPQRLALGNASIPRLASSNGGKISPGEPGALPGTIQARRGSLQEGLGMRPLGVARDIDWG